MITQKTNELYTKISSTGFIIAIGIVYGDLGTSPLYVFKSIIRNHILDHEIIFGSISCIFWTLTLQTTFKYIFLTLKADNKGEGGIFALFSLVRKSNKWLFIPAIVGASALFADSVITPPISIASAVEGLKTIPYFSQIVNDGNNFTLSVVIVILCGLFLFQKLGTKVVGFSFGPIMIIWFMMIGILGIISVVQHIEIIKSLNPYYGYLLLTKYPGGFWFLGAIFLCTTGAEALYSDLGICGKKNIEISWIFIKICLIFNYLGQGAFLLNEVGTEFAGENPFFSIMPSWFLWIGVIISTIAAVIASQALISGTFTLISEAISLNFWPRVTIKYPSDVKGHIYIPSINYILFIFCLLVVLIYKKSSNMEAAFGFAICTTMIMTTLLMGFYMIAFRKWNIVLSSCILLIFIIVETSFFIANSPKLKHALLIVIFMLALIFIMLVWYLSTIQVDKYLQFSKLKNYLNKIIDLSFDKNIPLYATHLVFASKSNEDDKIEKSIIESILFKKPKKAVVYWVVNIQTTDEPYQMNYNIVEIYKDSFYKINFKLGFKIEARLNILLKQVMLDMKNNNELRVNSPYENIDIKNFHADMTYVFIENFFSIENELPFFTDKFLSLYFWLKAMSQHDKKVFGLDSSNIIIESTPLIMNTKSYIELQRESSQNNNNI
ncbi:MAG: KUP/HAK/KT family potassium transporter [Alphaproteobacteria bacterium]|nr:KUP/HAK/KT family potassium transporter [Alphaproteobacteria bacterium]